MKSYKEFINEKASYNEASLKSYIADLKNWSVSQLNKLIIQLESGKIWHWDNKQIKKLTTAVKQELTKRK